MQHPENPGYFISPLPRLLSGDHPSRLFNIDTTETDKFSRLTSSTGLFRAGTLTSSMSTQSQAIVSKVQAVKLFVKKAFKFKDNYQIFLLPFCFVHHKLFFYWIPLENRLSNVGWLISLVNRVVDGTDRSPKEKYILRLEARKYTAQPRFVFSPTLCHNLRYM